MASGWNIGSPLTARRTRSRSSIDGMTKREAGFLLIGIGLGGLLVAAAVMIAEVVMMPYLPSTRSSATLLVLAGLVLMAVLCVGLVLMEKTRISE